MRLNNKLKAYKVTYTGERAVYHNGVRHARISHIYMAPSKTSAKSAGLSDIRNLFWEEIPADDITAVRMPYYDPLCDGGVRTCIISSRHTNDWDCGCSADEVLGAMNEEWVKVITEFLENSL